MAEPVMEFKDEQQLCSSLKEWQERLFLTDWTIKATLVDFSEVVYENYKDVCGDNTYNSVNQFTVIRVIRHNDEMRSRIQKCCHEKTLVHELLHLKLHFPIVGTFESSNLDQRIHTFIDQMAKSFIMAKYDLPFDWFKNFKESDEG